MNLDIPRDKGYPEDSVQCNLCGGLGCDFCQDRGWLTPKDHPGGRRCGWTGCRRPLKPAHLAVYCCNECAHADA